MFKASLCCGHFLLSSDASVMGMLQNGRTLMAIATLVYAPVPLKEVCVSVSHSIHTILVARVLHMLLQKGMRVSDGWGGRLKFFATHTHFMHANDALFGPIVRWKHTHSIVSVFWRWGRDPRANPHCIKPCTSAHSISWQHTVLPLVQYKTYQLWSLLLV
jgi:hypothetical protein